MIRLLLQGLLAISLASFVSCGNDEKLTISRHYKGDMFFGHGATCNDDFCDVGGKRFAKSVRRGSCQCQCASSTPTFRDDLGVCVEDVEECVLADYVSSSTTEKVPFVFLPLKGQLIHPDAEIALSDMRAEGETLLSPVCVVSKAHFLTPSGWVVIENGTTAEPPFSLYRDETKTYLQWLGDGALRASLDGRLVLVRLLCKDMENSRLGVFSPCIGFRVAGSPGVAETVFEGGALDGSPVVSGSVLPQSNYVAIGVASGVLGLLYVGGVVAFLAYRRKRKAVDLRKSKLNSISSPIVEEGKLKSNPLMMQSPSVGKLRRTDTGSPQNLALVDHNEAMALFKDATRRHMSSTHMTSPEFAHLSHQLAAGLLPGQVPTIEDDILDAQLYQAGIDPSMLTKEDRDFIMGQSRMEVNGFEMQSPEFLSRVRSAIDSARLKMASRKFFPSLFDIPEEHKDYGSVSRHSSFRTANNPKVDMKPQAPMPSSSDSGANGDNSDSSQPKSITDESSQPIYVPRLKKSQSKEKDKLYDALRKNVASTLERVKKTLSTKDEAGGIQEEKQKQQSVYTNPSIEAIYGSLARGKQTEVKEKLSLPDSEVASSKLESEVELLKNENAKHFGYSQVFKGENFRHIESTNNLGAAVNTVSKSSADSHLGSPISRSSFHVVENEPVNSVWGKQETVKAPVPAGKVGELVKFANSKIRESTTFGEVANKPINNRLRISEKLAEADSEKVMKPAERIYDLVKKTSFVEIENAQPKPLMVEKATYTTMTIMRPTKAVENTDSSLEDMVSEAESKVPKFSSDSELDNPKPVPKKIWFEPDSLDRPRRAFEPPQKSFLKNSKAKSDRYESRKKTDKDVKKVRRKLATPEVPEGCDSSVSTCKSVKSLSRILPGGDELEFGNDVFNLVTGTTTLRKAEKKEVAESHTGHSRPTASKITSSGDISDASTTSKHEVWNLAGDSNWFAKPSEKVYSSHVPQEEQYNSSDSCSIPVTEKMENRITIKMEDKSEFSHSDDNGFEPDTLEKHASRSRRDAFIDSLERPEMSRSVFSKPSHNRLSVPMTKARNPQPELRQSFNKRDARSVDRELDGRPPRREQSALSKSLSSFEKMVDESPAPSMRSLRQLFESTEESKSPAPPRPVKSIDMNRLNVELKKTQEQRLHQRQRSVPDLPPKLPPRTGGVLPPVLPPKKLPLSRSSSVDDLLDYEPIGSVHSGMSGYDDVRSTASSVYDLLQRIDDFEREESMFRPSHILDEEGQVVEGGISKGMEIALQIRAKMLENKNAKSSIKIKLRKFLEKMEDTFSETDASPSKKEKHNSFSRSDTLKSRTSRASTCSVTTSEGSRDSASQKQTLAEQNSIHSDTDWHFSAQSTPQNGRRSTDQSDKVSLGSDGTGQESSCSYDTLKTRRSYPAKPAENYGFFVNDIFSSDTGKKRMMSSIDSGVFSTGQLEGRMSGLK